MMEAARPTVPSTPSWVECRAAHSLTRPAAPLNRTTVMITPTNCLLVYKADHPFAGRLLPTYAPDGRKRNGLSASGLCARGDRPKERRLRGPAHTLPAAGSRLAGVVTDAIASPT